MDTSRRGATLNENPKFYMIPDILLYCQNNATWMSFWGITKKFFQKVIYTHEKQIILT